MGVFLVFTDHRFKPTVDHYEDYPLFCNYGLIVDIHPLNESDESGYCTSKGIEKHLGARYSNIIVMMEDNKFHTNICDKFPVVILKTISDIPEFMNKIKELVYKNLLGKFIKNKKYLEKILTPGESLWQ